MGTAKVDQFDIVIVGGGVIGLAVAYQLSRNPAYANKNIVILEREKNFGMQTSSRNSEVIHAGIYYTTESLKAELCLKGRELLYDYCQRFEIPHARIGKLIVAQSGQESTLEALAKKAIENGVNDLTTIDQALLKRIEPALAASSALFSPSTGIVDSHSYMQSLLTNAEQQGVIFSRSTSVESIKPEDKGFRLLTIIDDGRLRQPYALRTKIIINCAGLGALNLAAMVFDELEHNDSRLQWSDVFPEQLFSKGSYFDYTGRNPFTHLIYPLPDSENDALGIHATIDLSGALRFGPDAEWYERIDYSVDPSKAVVFARSVQQYFPTLDSSKLKPGYAGIRTKLKTEGAPSDFVIRNEDEAGLPHLINLFGIDSPGLTSSLAIAGRVESLLAEST
ncbi:MAG: NAD(P)/FAD-dependent oxidoreductase [Pseudohongiellaceae bacterium]